MEDSEWWKPSWLWAWELFLRRFWRGPHDAVREWDLDERLLRVRGRVMAELSREAGDLGAATSMVLSGDDLKELR